MDGLFVGRESELKVLRRAADEACDGRRQIVMLAGEAGIGKTRAAQELEAYASAQGALVLWGRSRESAGAPPYWPWVQAGRALGAAIDLEMLRDAMGPEAAELQRIFPELATLFPDLPPLPEVVDGAATRFMLFEAVTALYRRASAQQPIVLILEDLHWADRPTLLLLGHLVAEQRDARLLVVGTYRDAELSRNEPLSDLVVELNRESGFEHLPLAGLSERDVGRYLREASSVEPSSTVIGRIRELTEGNPFFMEQLTSLVSPERMAGERALDEVALPDGLRAALRQRLARLSVESAELLTLAAIAGREFTYALLALLDASDDDALLRLLEEGIDTRIIEEMAEAGRYRFVHALMRETLLAEVSATRRAHMHGRVAEALERRWGGRVEEYTSRLAAHFVESAAVDRAHVEQALRYSRLAGEQAEQDTAWDDAIGHYERALALVREVGGELAEPEPELLMRLGSCYRDAARTDAAWDHLIRAIDIYRERGDAVGQARATFEISRAFAPPEHVVALVQEALDRLGTRDPHLEARLHGELLRGVRRIYESEAQTLAHRARAAELAEQHGYEEVKAFVAHGDMITAETAGDREAAVKWGEEAGRRFEAVGMPVRAADVLQKAASNALLAGQLDRAIELAQACIAHSRSLHTSVWEDFAVGSPIAAHLHRAEFDEVAALIADYVGSKSITLSLLRPHIPLALGDVAGARAQLPQLDSVENPELDEPALHATRARVHYASRDRPAAEREFQLMNEVSAADPRTTQAAGWRYSHRAISLLDDAFVDIASPSILRTWFDSKPFREPYFWTGSPLLTYAHVGLALEEYDRATEAFEELLAIARRERTPIIEGRCHLGLAEVAAARGEHAAALAELDAAVACFEPHPAVPYLEQARTRLEELRGTAGSRQRGSDGLTARELEVLRLIAGGKSSRVMAEELVLSIRTIERHIANIYAKTDTHSRAQATAYALKQGLD